MRLAIIGGGFSGALTALHFLRAAPPDATLHLFEPRPALGLGVAYSTTFDAHRLNVPASRMSAIPDEPDDFLAWLTAHRIPVRPEQFAPRAFFGRYVIDRFDEARRAAPGVTFHHHPQTITALRRPANQAGWRLTTDTIETIDVDAAVLAIGHGPPRWPRPFAVRNDPRLITDPWKPDALAAIPPDAPVLLLGTGLTMLDIVLRLTATPRSQPLHAISRHGRLPHAHLSPPVPAPYQLPDALLTMRAIRPLLQELRKLAAEQASADSKWHAVIDALRPHTAHLWRNLPDDEKRRFLRHVRSIWDVHRHRAAPDIHQRIEQLRQSGQLVVRPARLLDVKPTTDALDCLILPRGAAEPEHTTYDFLVNCTGPGLDVSADPRPLVRQLRADRLIQPDPLGLGVRTDETGRLLDDSNRPHPDLYTLGALRVGELWESTAVPELRAQARDVIHQLTHL